MNVHLWWCSSMNQWRYTVVNDSRPILKQKSGQSKDLSEAMDQIKIIINNLSS